MKICIETLRRVVNYHRHAKEFLRMPIEDRYAWQNVLIANQPTIDVSLPHFISKIRQLEDTVLGYDTERIERILLGGNPTLERDKPASTCWSGPLGYEKIDPYGDDFTHDTRRINVVNTLAAAPSIEEKSNLAFLMSESTRISRSIIDGRSFAGYYFCRPPRLTSDVVSSALTFFEESRQQEKELRLAERTKRYTVAARIALQQGKEMVAAEMLYLNGDTDRAIKYILEETKEVACVHNWLAKNLELERAKNYSSS